MIAIVTVIFMLTFPIYLFIIYLISLPRLPYLSPDTPLPFKKIKNAEILGEASNI